MEKEVSKAANARLDRLRDLDRLRHLDRAYAKIVRFPVLSVQQSLGLAPLSFDGLLGSRCWLIGGRVLRWLTSERLDGDVDLCFADFQAVDQALAVLLSRGGVVAAVRTWRERLCSMCGAKVGSAPPIVVRQIARLRRYQRPSWCRKCTDVRLSPTEEGETTGTRPILSINEPLVRRSGLRSIEVRTPASVCFQLSTAHLMPSISAAAMSADLSICQLATDGETLVMTRACLSDIIDSRISLGVVRSPAFTARRLVKYGLRGYRPRLSIP